MSTYITTLILYEYLSESLLWWSIISCTRIAQWQTGLFIQYSLIQHIAWSIPFLDNMTAFFLCLFLMPSTPNGLNTCFNILTTPKVDKDSYVGNVYPHISKAVVAMTTESGDKSDVNTFIILSLLQFWVQLWNMSTILDLQILGELAA